MAGPLTPDEIEARRNGIGGSDMPSLFGLGYRTAVEVWADKVYGVDQAPNALMVRGSDLEPLVADKWSEQTGIEIEAAGMIWHPTEPLIFATLDYRPVDRPTEVGPECKVVDKWAEWKWEDGPPLGVQLQCQMQMAVTGATICYVAAMWLDLWEVRPYAVERDDTAIASAILWAGRFWEDHVLTMRPPPVTAARDAAALRWVVERDDAEARVEPDTVARWAAAKATASAAKTEAETARAEILGALNGAKTGVGPDGTVLVTARVHMNKGKPVWTLMEPAHD